MTPMPCSHDVDRRFYGYRLRTDLPLTSLPSLPGDEAADMELSVGDVPDHLSAPVWTSPFIEIGSNDEVLVRLGQQVRFLLRQGRWIVVNPAALSQMAVVESMLHGVVGGVVLHQRGDLILHASCVVVGDRAVAIAGPSGRGKSTLAGALVAQGHGLLTEDLCRIRFADGAAWAIPGSSWLRLWPDAAGVLGHEPDSLPLGRPGHPKRLLRLPPAAQPAVRLDGVVRLRVDARQEEPVLTRLLGPGAIMPMEDLVYRARLGRRLGRRIGLFQDLARLAGLARFFSLTRGENPAALPEQVRLVLSALEEGR
jgi:hypothetical protein